MAPGPREQSSGAWLRGADGARGSCVSGKLLSGQGPRARVRSVAARRLRTAAAHGSGAGRAERGAAVRVGAPRKPRLGATCPAAEAAAAATVAVVAVVGAVAAPPLSTRLDHTALARGPGQPITRAPEARPLLFPAPPQLRRKGSEVKMLPARTGGPQGSHRVEGALLRAPPLAPAPENAAPEDQGWTSRLVLSA